MSEDHSAVSACQHPEAVGTRWGDSISDARKAELKALANQQRKWAKKPEAEWVDSPFNAVRLTGADVFWLMVLVQAGPMGDTAQAEEWLLRARKDRGVRIALDWPALHLEGAFLSYAHLEGTNLNRARLVSNSFVASDSKFRRIRHWTPSSPSTLAPADIHGAFFDSATTLTKYIQVTFAAWEPIIERTACGRWLWRAKKSVDAARSALRDANNSQWVTSRRQWRQSISMGLSQGL